MLLLQIQAAADFFSLNKTLMTDPPLVDVDIILDPYILNIFPQSLLPTAGYIAIVAVASYFLATYTYTFLTPGDIVSRSVIADNLRRKCTNTHLGQEAS